LNIDEIAGAGEELGQDGFHGFGGLPGQSSQAEGSDWEEGVTGGRGTEGAC